MMRFMKMKLAVTVLALVASMACAQPASNDPQSVTADYLLNTLVQIAVTEDLADDKRIGELLKIDMVMIAKGPVETIDGKNFSGATADIQPKLGYLQGGDSFYYRRWTGPKRTGLLSVGINSQKVCVQVADVYANFIKLGNLNPLPAPSQVPPPPGTFYPPVKKDQPIYGYAFSSEKVSGSLTFRYTNCLTDIQLVQPAEKN